MSLVLQSAFFAAFLYYVVVTVATLHRISKHLAAIAESLRVMKEGA